MLNRQKGFSLIELIVVIAIIAILSAIVLVGVSKHIYKSKVAAARANLNQMPILAAKWLGQYGAFDVTAPDPGAGGQEISFTHHSEYGVKIKNTIEPGGDLTIYMGYSDGTFNNVCGSDKWYADASDESGVLLCVDSTGAKKTTGNSSANYNACACQ